MNNIIVMIPARGGSKGIPRKNLVPLCGKPLVAWTIEQALAADIGRVVVATDDTDIARLARESYGVEVLHEPYTIAADTVSMETVIEWALAQFGSNDPEREIVRDDQTPDWLILLQPTSPLRLSGHIKEVAAICKTNAFNSVFSVVPSAHCSWRVDGDKKPLAEWPQAGPFKRMLRQQAGQQWTENGAIYAINVEAFQDTRFIPPMHAYEMPEWTAWEVDTEDDLAIVELIMRTRLRLGANGVTT